MKTPIQKCQHLCQALGAFALLFLLRQLYWLGGLLYFIV